MPEWRFSYPFIHLNLRNPYEAWKRYPFWAEPPRIGHYREYPPGISTYNIQIQPIKYSGLISTLRHYYNTNFLGKKPSSTDTPDNFSETFILWIANDKANRDVHQKLLSFKSTVPFKSQEKWNNSIKSDERCSADWTSAYCLQAARCTKSTKLVNFQFRFLHRILPTNLS